MQRTRHLWLLSCLVTLLLVSCSSSPPSNKKQAVTPVATASVLVSVPGGPACQPMSPVIVPRGNETPAGVGLPQVEGKAPGGQLWALIFNGWPMQVGQQNKIVWRMTGSGNLGLVASGPGGRVVHPTDVIEHDGSNWLRPGDEWGSSFTFPASGCWDIHATRDTLVGDIWVTVVVPYDPE